MIPGMTMSGGLEVLRNLDGFGVQQLQNIIESEMIWSLCEQTNESHN